MDTGHLDAPVAIVDLNRLATNIATFQSYLNKHGIANRPHIKTHKIPAIAHMQVKAGAVGITCQKLGEAEIMAQEGIKDIFIPYNILGEAKLERLMELTRRAHVSVAADSEVVVAGLAAAARRAGMTLDVLVECDTGYGRCGVQSPQEAVDLARRIVCSSSLCFAGLMTYPTSAQTDSFMRAIRELFTADGIAVERVSGGGTAVMWQAHTHPEVTEHRAGMYVYGDRLTLCSGAMQLTDCAFKVITTVVSRPTRDRGILDAGNKTLSAELLWLDGYGLILEYPQAHIYMLSEEHGHVDFSRCPRRPEVGERVTVIPNISNAVTNLFNEVVGVRNGAVEVIWPVACRGKVQ